MSIPPDLIHAALLGDTSAVVAITSRIDRVTGAILSRYAPRWRRALPVAEDIRQDVLLALFSDGDRGLRAWRSTGVEPGAFIDDVTRVVVSRTLKRMSRARARLPALPAMRGPRSLAVAGLCDRADPGPSSELVVSASEIEQAIYESARLRLSKEGRRFLQRFFVEGRSVDDLVDTTRKTQFAVRKWHSRVRTAVDRAALEILSRERVISGGE